ncbi:MAG: hypothetical protein EBZ47_04105 [Chlamydiae bacterium]|nr:hypothetical protein [Chlamydiota bacterium]
MTTICTHADTRNLSEKYNERLSWSIESIAPHLPQTIFKNPKFWNGSGDFDKEVYSALKDRTLSIENPFLHKLSQSIKWIWGPRKQGAGPTEEQFLKALTSFEHANLRKWARENPEHKVTAYRILDVLKKPGKPLDLSHLNSLSEPLEPILLANRITSIKMKETCVKPDQISKLSCLNTITILSTREAIIPEDTILKGLKRKVQIYWITETNTQKRTYFCFRKTTSSKTKNFTAGPK